MRRINPEEMAMRATTQIPEALVGFHLGNPFRTAGGEVEGEEEEEEHKEEEKKGDLKEGATRFMQEFVAPQRKKAMWVATP